MVVDDEKPARVRLTELLQREPDVEMVGTASDGRQALDLLRRVKPDLLFLDVQMPELDGLGVLRQLTPEEFPITIMVTALRQARDSGLRRARDRLPAEAVQRPAVRQRDRPCAPISGVGRRARRPRSSPLRPRSAAMSTHDQATSSASCLKANGCITFVDVDDVDWIEAAGVYVYLHAGPEESPVPLQRHAAAATPR